LRPFAGAEHKGAVSASFRRPTKVFEDGVQKSNNKYLLNMNGITASRGAFHGLRTPNRRLGRDRVARRGACMAGAATINK
jgi:hypothetical protein